MKLKNPLLVVEDIDKSVEFYREVLGLRVTADFGANKTLTGGLCLQTRESWVKFIEKQDSDIKYRGNNFEIYFEEDDFDSFIKKLNGIENIDYIHPAKEHSWGQRAVRFYDPDGHIIEIGENMKSVCKRFIDDGMSMQEIAKRMDVPLKYVEAFARKAN